MTVDMNVNRSASEVLKKPIVPNSASGVYLWLIIGCSIGGALLLTVLIATLVYIRRKINRSKKVADLTESSYIPGSEFCPNQMISSFSSSSDELSEAHRTPGRHFRRPLGPSSSLDPPSLLRLTSECVQPKPSLTRWHTVASPHCQTTTVLGTVEAERDSDDDLPRNPHCLHGRLWFSLVYHSEASRLEVTVVKAKYLPGRGLINSPRDPFVKVYLLPDEETFFQSKIRKRTLSPKFNETFSFNVAQEDMVKRTVKLSVYDVDKKKVRHCLGHVLVPLNDPSVLSGEIICKDLELVPQSSVSAGEIQLCLSCNSYSNRIKATVCRLRNLQDVPLDNAAIYVKVQLYHGRKMIKSKRTVPQTWRPGSELVIDETFAFAVSCRFFDSCSFAFTAVAAGPSPLFKDTSLGRVVIGPFMYARGDALQHWQEMLRNSRNQVTRWHNLEPVRKS